MLRRLLIVHINIVLSLTQLMTSVPTVPALQSLDVF